MYSNPPDRLKPPCQKFTGVLEYLSSKARNMVMAICAVHQCCPYPSKPVVPTCEAPRVSRRSIQENSCDTTNQRLQNHALQNQFVTLWALSSCQSDMRFPMWVPGISLLAQMFSSVFCVFCVFSSWNRWPPLRLKTASQVSRMQLFQSFLCILGLQFLEPLSTEESRRTFGVSMLWYSS